MKSKFKQGDPVVVLGWHGVVGTFLRAMNGGKAEVKPDGGGPTRIVEMKNVRAMEGTT